MMAFSTGRNDKGLSTLIKGGKVSKGDPIFELLGSVDELNAFIGLAISAISDTQINADLRAIQHILSKMMGIFAGADLTPKAKIEISSSTEWLEEKIDLLGKSIEPQQEFSFPGKTEPGARLDVCRTVARRVERQAVAITKSDQSPIPDYYPFLNRISSYFFVLRQKFET